jgi:Ca2+-binding EF-hand superfamily protein
MRCAAESRRLVESGTGKVARNVDLDNIDNCNEVLLGLLATFTITFLVSIFALPFFNIVLMPWMKSWEPEPITLQELKVRMYAAYPNPDSVFWEMDADKNGLATLSEFLTVAQKFKPPVNGTDGDYAFHGLDINRDSFLSRTEFKEALDFPSLFYVPTTTTTTTLAAPAPVPAPLAPAPAPAPAPQPATQTKAIYSLLAAPNFNQLLWYMDQSGKSPEADYFRKIDLDNDGFAANGEFRLGLSRLSPPIVGEAAQKVFQDLDLNGDNVVESTEFFEAFQAKRYLPPQRNGQTMRTPGEVQALQDLKLSWPPITMEQFKSSMGAVTPDVAFMLLDANHDGEISEQEMFAGSHAFAPPLSQVQATFVHRGLDINRDGMVVKAELYDTLKTGHFFPTMAEAQAIHR